jgi:predicted MPP superfamily phosphohydrolase
LTERLFTFHDLPSAFDGYRILHLTDLHLDNIDEVTTTARPWSSRSKPLASGC